MEVRQPQIVTPDGPCLHSLEQPEQSWFQTHELVPKLPFRAALIAGFSGVLRPAIPTLRMAFVNSATLAQCELPLAGCGVANGVEKRLCSAFAVQSPQPPPRAHLNGRQPRVA